MQNNFLCFDIYRRYFISLDVDDDITSLADNDAGNDRSVTQKRRYSRLSDGYERLKGVLPTVKDKRRVSKVGRSFNSINILFGY